jgi:3-oxoacyl-[acyl-carrier protein] reductase
MNLSLSGKVALITGGSRGIGAATVRMFVAAGARVMFNYQKAKTAADKLVNELGKDNCAAVACDLSGTDAARELVAATISRFGRLDILVANHGVWPAADMPIDLMSNGAALRPSIWTVCSGWSSIRSPR